MGKTRNRLLLKEVERLSAALGASHEQSLSYKQARLNLAIRVVRAHERGATLAEIGKYLGLQRAHVWQLEAHGLRFLRRTPEYIERYFAEPLVDGSPSERRTLIGQWQRFFAGLVSMKPHRDWLLMGSR